MDEMKESDKKENRRKESRRMERERASQSVQFVITIYYRLAGT